MNTTNVHRLGVNILRPERQPYENYVPNDHDGFDGDFGLNDDETNNTPEHSVSSEDGDNHESLFTTDTIVDVIDNNPNLTEKQW